MIISGAWFRPFPYVQSANTRVHVLLPFSLVEGCWQGALGTLPTSSALLGDPASERHWLGEIPGTPVCLLRLPKATLGC